MRKRIVVVIGTRPEAIKLIPLFTSLKKENFDVFLCATFQHTEMLEQVLNLFDVVPDFNLNTMKTNQDLSYLTTVLLEKMRDVFLRVNPDLVIVQGDTTTAFAAALAAFYLKISVAHVEAGLRTGDMQAPYPEEMNRRVISLLASYHFAPTALSVGHLLAEGVARTSIFCIGNTVVDALNQIKTRIDAGTVPLDSAVVNWVKQQEHCGRRIVLLTAHRRESFGQKLQQIFNGIKKCATTQRDVAIFYPVHPNPNVLSALEDSGLKEIKNIYLSQPIAYADLVFLLSRAALVVTDSGGIQEEAMSLGKFVLVLRDTSERVEGFWEGRGKLVGTNEMVLSESMSDFLGSKQWQSKESSLFGDGKSVGRIVTILKTIFNEKNIVDGRHINRANNVINTGEVQ